MTMVEQACNLSGRKLTDYIPPTKFRAKQLILDNNELNNIRNVKYCTSIRKLSASHNAITDLSPVGSLPYLQELLLVDNVIDKISGVGDCTELRVLNLSRNCLRTFTGLYHCTALTLLDLSYNSIEALVDISVLVNLQELHLQGNEISSLESAPLCLPSSLLSLSLADNGITDIGQLAYLTRLKSLSTLTLGGNQCAGGGTVPYQLFAVMCCPSLSTVDTEPVSEQHREHAQGLVQHMRITGDSNFSPVREARPRSKTAFTLKDELSRQDYSKDNILDRANKKDKEHFGQKNEVVESIERVQAVQSSYTAYDEYNDRPATSGTPRTHKIRRSSEAVIPPNFLPGAQMIVPRERSRSLFEQSEVSLLDESRNRGASVASVSRTAEPEISFEEEDELECESMYVDINTSPTECLDTAHCLEYEDDTSSQASLSSYLVPSIHDEDEPSIQSNEISRAASVQSIQSNESSLNNGTSHILDTKSSTSIASSEVEKRTDISYVSSERPSNYSSERRSEISYETERRSEISAETRSDVSAECRNGSSKGNQISPESRRRSDAFFIGLEEVEVKEVNTLKKERNGDGYFIDLKSNILPVEEGGVRASFLIEQAQFGDYNLRHHIAATHIQARYRGVLSRRNTQSLINELSLRRYKRYCETLTDTIAQLSAALVKEREVSSLNRSMITNLCLRVKTQSQRPRSSPATPITPCQACQACHSRTSPPAAPTLVTSTTQTEGILNSLLASFSSPPLNKQNEMFQYDSPGQVALLQYEATPNKFERTRTRTPSAASATSPPTSPIRSETSGPTSPARRSHKSSFSELMIHKRTTPPSRVDSPLSSAPSTPSKLVNDNLSCSLSTPSKIINIINIIDNPLACAHSPSNNSDFNTAYNSNIKRSKRTKSESSEIENKRVSDEYQTPRYEIEQNNDNINDSYIHLQSQRAHAGSNIQPPPEGINESVGMGVAIRNTLDMVKSSLFSFQSKTDDFLSATNEMTLPVKEKSLKDSSSPSTDLRLSLDQFKSLNQLMDESNESNKSNVKFSQI